MGRKKMALQIQLLSGEARVTFHIGNEVLKGSVEKSRMLQDDGNDKDVYNIRLERGERSVLCSKTVCNYGLTDPQYQMQVFNIQQHQGVDFCLEWLDAVTGNIASEIMQGGRGIMDADQLYNLL